MDMGVIRLQHASVPMPIGGNDEARAFYNGILGMEEVAPPSSLDPDRIVWFKAGDAGHEVHRFTDEGHGPNAAQHLCLQLDDIGAMRTHLETLGVPIEEPVKIHNRPRFNVHDPFGNLIELTQITGDYQEA
jgi:catechol 2,3-dioxygenase-like lactoylglutathione lyase family enzyme